MREMEHMKSPSYSDFWWDTCNPTEREQTILNEQVIPSVLLAKKTVPFYMEHYKRLGVTDIQNLTSFEDFAETIPYISKRAYCQQPPTSFYPTNRSRGS